jgi:hypothetical protein
VQADPAATVPKECVDYEPSTPPDASAVGLAGARASLPDGVILNPGIQVIPSTDDPGAVEVVARVCSAGLDRAELVDVGNAIAQVLYADPSRDSVTLLMVSSYVPTGDFLDSQPNLDPIRSDFELFLWDGGADRLDSNWQ